MSYRDWHVGMKIVCVDDSVSHWAADSRLRRGSVYTIRELVDWRGEVGVKLDEIVLPYSERWNDEYGYRAIRFRPVQKRATDISIHDLEGHDRLHPLPTTRGEGEVTREEKAKLWRDELGKLRHWIDGYEAGSGRTIPKADALRLTQLFLDEIIRDSTRKKRSGATK